MRHYKAGDVALVKCSDGEWRKAQYRASSILHEARWAFPDGAYRRVDASEARPLVVLDPEDRDDIEAFVASTWPFAVTKTALADDLQRGLRKRVPPEKPPEPMKWLAVVEDSAGLAWFTHRNDPNIEWEDPWYCQDLDEYRDYADIDAVEVISEGIG